MMSENSGNKKSIREIVGSLNKNTIGILICAAVLVLVLLIFFVVRGSSDSGKSKNDEPKTSMTVEAAAQIGDSDTTGISTDTKDDDSWNSMTDEEYGVSISKVEDGYTGQFVEDGSDESVKNILALRITNNGTQDIQYGEYVFSIDDTVVTFKFSSLPVGQSCVVLEAGKHKYKEEENLNLVTRVVAQTEELPFARDQILIVDNSDDTITIMNLTDKELPSVRAFYKTFDEENNTFVGGITYTAKAESIPAGGGVTVAPAHYHSGKSVVVGSGVYESE